MGKPEIRFEGYSGEWEERELTDITTKIGSGKTPSGGKSAYVAYGIPLIRSQNVNNDRVDLGDIVFIDEKTDASMSNSRVLTNDVLLNITGASIGRSAVYKGLEHANVNQHVCIIRPTDEFNSDFIQLNLTTVLGQQQIDASQAGGGREGLNFQSIGKFHFMFPSSQEQAKIGEYFANLDNLITLHQRKCEETKKLKKYMLQKMFPQDGANVPEIRFAGFTDAWEQRKLSTCAGKTYGGGTPKTSVDEYWDGDIPWFQSADLTEHEVLSAEQKKSITELGLQKSATQLVPKNSIAIVTRVGVGKLAFMPFSYATSQDFLSLSELNIDAKFGCYSIYKLLQREKNFTQGTSIKGITKDELLSKQILVPKLEEQTKIGEYFSTLDQTITLHQRKLDELQNIKKYMLSKMFT